MTHSTDNGSQQATPRRYVDVDGQTRVVDPETEEIIAAYYREAYSTTPQRYVMGVDPSEDMAERLNHSMIFADYPGVQIGVHRVFLTEPRPAHLGVDPDALRRFGGGVDL